MGACLIIRTHYFEQSQIDNIKGNFANIINEDPKIKETMNKKGIKLPKEIKEFYVNSVDENGNYNSNKIGDILEIISTKDPLYQNIKYSDIKERREGKIIIKYKIMTFQDFGKDESHSVEIQTDVIGADETICEEVGSPYKRTCKKGYWQDYQKYSVKYDKNGGVENKVPLGSKYTEQV